MTNNQNVDSSRRAFFRAGSVALAAMTPAAASAAGGVLAGQDQATELRQKLADLEDRDAIRELQSAYHNLIERGGWERVPALFTADAQVTLNGRRFQGEAVANLFSAGRDQEEARMQTAFRDDPGRPNTPVTIEADRTVARANYFFQVEVSTPYRADTTLEAMARQQGLFAGRRWVNGEFAMTYRKEAGRWKISHLVFDA